MKDALGRRSGMNGLRGRPRPKDGLSPRRCSRAPRAHTGYCGNTPSLRRDGTQGLRPRDREPCPGPKLKGPF